MSNETTTASGWRADPAAGRIAIVSGIVAAVGVVCLILFYVLYFATPLKDVGSFFGGLNDALIAIQYLLTIPLALSLRRILRPHAPRRIEVATFVGIASMLAVVALQTALVFGVLTFQQQVLWVSLAMIVGVGFWLVTTALVARATGRFPQSLRMSLVAVPYLGYPIWAFWLGKLLLRF
ncbi:MAG: hypothetical protein M3T56_11500 [Chloroflexota bacterium]|nr:hypothetical protein [Chloroflexota bacterium]